MSPSSDCEALVLDIWGVESTPSLSLLPGSLWLGVVVPVRIPCMDQIDLLKNYSYLIELCAKNKIFLKKQIHKNIQI